MQNLVALSVRLKHSVLDAVVNHLHIVSGSGWAHVRVAVGWRERLEDRVAQLEGFIGGADHQAIAILQSPDAAASPRVDELDSVFVQLRTPTHRVVKVRVAAIDDPVAAG